MVGYRESTNDIPEPKASKAVNTLKPEAAKGRSGFLNLGAGRARARWLGLPDRKSYNFQVRETASPPPETSQGKSHRNNIPTSFFSILAISCQSFPLAKPNWELEVMELTDVHIWVGAEQSGELI